MALMPEPLILASASTARSALLRMAGLDFCIEPANIDERALKKAGRAAGKTAVETALQLAETKARIVSDRFASALTIGADQILVAGDEWFDKPAMLAEARTQLVALRGRRHCLATAVCVARAGTVLWHSTAEPELTMREFTDTFLDGYLADEGNALLGSVGAYRLEGRGVQLFARINGDYFAVLGLPLIELLKFLRDRGVSAE
jgi:septum formation protein